MSDEPQAPDRGVPSGELELTPAFAGDQMMQRLSRMIEERTSEDGTLPDIGEIVAEFNRGAGPEALNDADRAQTLVYEASEAASIEDACRLVDRALALDPQCVDALAFRASNLTDTTADEIAGLRLAVKAGEAALGRAFFEENRGSFWGLLETRPYMRARSTLAWRLKSLAEFDDARGHLEAMLELNPNDNQGNRYLLLALLLERGDLDRARALHDQFAGEGTANMLVGRVLLEWLDRNEAAAEDALRVALKQNPHVLGVLTDSGPADEEAPSTYTPGDLSEAAGMVDYFGDIVHDRSALLAWLTDQEARFDAQALEAWAAEQARALGTEPPTWLARMFADERGDSLMVAPAIDIALDVEGDDLRWLQAILTDDEITQGSAVGRGIGPIRAARMLGKIPSAEHAALLVQRVVELEREGELEAVLLDAALVGLGSQGAHAVPPCLAALAQGHKLSPNEPSGLYDVLATAGVKDERIFEHLMRQLGAHPYWLATPVGEYGDSRALPMLHEALEAVGQAWERLADYTVEGLCRSIEVLGGTLAESEQQLLERARSGLERRRSTYLNESEDEDDVSPVWDDIPLPPLKSAPVQKTERPGRNEPCWCGSGTKYKRCHLAEDDVAQSGS